MTEITQSGLADMARKLEVRRTRLRPPADGASLARLEAAIGGPLSKQARALFLVFDGFEADVADEETMVCLWSSDTICRNASINGNLANGCLIGDYFLSAELFRCDLRDEFSMVWWNDRNTVAADSLFDFWWQVSDGTF